MASAKQLKTATQNLAN